MYSIYLIIAFCSSIGSTFELDSYGDILKRETIKILCTPMQKSRIYKNMHLPWLDARRARDLICPVPELLAYND
jgi:hypothetical protein